MLTIEQLYDLNHTLAADYLRQFTYPWEALAGIKAEILHHRRADGSAALRVHPRQCAGRGRLCGRQLCGAEERDSF